MSEFAGLDLRRADGRPALGASFVLRSPSPETRCVSLGDWTVDVIEGSKVVLARGAGSGGYEEALYEGLEAANQGLDLICAMSADRHLIEKAAEEHLAWWIDPASGALTVAALAEVVSAVRGGPVVLTVLDANGNVVPPTPAPRPRWHPSYRYFRVSQTTRDLHDAYRNGFLALESLLDHVAPQRKREGEGSWFRRATAIADSQISMAQVLLPQSVSAIDDLCDEFYTRGRTAVAHSKSSRTFVLPFTPSSRRSLTDALDRLHRFYLELAAHVLQLKRGGLWLAPAVLQAMDDGLANHVMFVTDDSAPMDGKDSRPSPSGRPMVAMSPPTSSRGGRRWWSLSGRAVADLDSIRRIVSVHDGQAGFIALLEADLRLSAADKFEAALSIRTVNAVDPVLRFST